MQRPATPENEDERLRVLQRYRILDTQPEAGFDDLLTIAAAVCGMPMGSVTLVDADRQWFKARIGLDAQETPRDTSFCAHAILDPHETTIVPDARLDPRFRDNPHVTGADGIRFYAGAPLLSSEGLPMGVLCVMDQTPRQLQPYQRDALDALSRQLSALLELRRVSHELNLQLQDRAWYEQQLQHFNRELQLQNADLSEQARVDPLTGLANRRELGAALEAALREAREESSPLCLALLDIDHFKDINDTYGHAAGDEVLVQVAGSLRGNRTGLGTIARHGGEEFAWLLPRTALAQAQAHCEALRETVAYASQSLPVTISIGLAQATPEDTVSSLMQRADQALYTAKRTGRDRVVVG
jgi:diguanylate cyclase (GGDEF)-like protein